MASQSSNSGCEGFSASSEIVQGRDQASAEQLMPNVIDRDAGVSGLAGRKATWPDCRLDFALWLERVQHHGCSAELRLLSGENRLECEPALSWHRISPSSEPWSPDISGLSGVVGEFAVEGKGGGTDPTR